MTTYKPNTTRFYLSNYPFLALGLFVGLNIGSDSFDMVTYLWSLLFAAILMLILRLIFRYRHLCIEFTEYAIEGPTSRILLNKERKCLKLDSIADVSEKYTLTSFPLRHVLIKDSEGNTIYVNVWFFDRATRDAIKEQLSPHLNHTPTASHA